MEKEMKNFTGLRIGELKNLGTVYVVKNDKTRKRAEFKSWVGTTVIIDGVQRVVKGVESYPMYWIHQNAEIGILTD